MFTSCAFGEGSVPARDDDCMEQQSLHPGREDCITGLDRELTIAKLMREADLPILDVAALRSIEIGHPDGGAMAIHHLGNLAVSTARPDHMDDYFVDLESLRLLSTDAAHRRNHGRLRSSSPKQLAGRSRTEGYDDADPIGIVQALSAEN